MNGEFAVSRFPGESGYGGPLSGSAAVGLGLETTKSGIVSLRPFIRQEFTWRVYAGLGFSATTRGQVGCVVKTDGGPTVSDWSGPPVVGPHKPNQWQR